MADAATPFSIVPLAPSHDRAAFRSGVEPLDRYFSAQATQDIKRRVAACFVAVERDTPIIAGYYTIASSSVPLPDLSPALIKKLPRYPLVPAVRIGRLAVAASHRGRGIGSGLLLDGIARAWRADIAVFAVVVDAKDDAAVAFYEHHGFARFVSSPMSLYLPLGKAAQSLGLAVP